ncbi:MAG TPA: pentapeptide repeat-containing protein [Gammaproteobacteria bacterium]|nr:pentapeptide repeat-containing protein [Gammaproteobacteria bacterium]
MRIRMTGRWLGMLCLLAATLGNTVQAGCNDRRAAGMDWSGCKKISKLLGGTDYTGSRFDDAILTLSKIDDSYFKDTSLVKADLTRVDATGSRFEDANLTKAVGYRANFDKVSLHRSNLSKSEFFRASFRKAEIVDVDWSKSELGRVDFTKAKLSDVDFGFSNLSRVDFDDAELSTVNFEGAYTFLTRFEGVDLRTVKMLTQAQLDQACGDSKTRVPEGLQASASWPCSDD